jgi:hypothetical protein
MRHQCVASILKPAFSTEAEQCGIRRLAPEKFDVLAKRIVVANPKVATMAGCVGRDDRASNVVAHIAGGLYDFYIGGTKTDQRSKTSVHLARVSV